MIRGRRCVFFLQARLLRHSPSSVNNRFEDDIAVAFENVNHLLYAGDVLGGAGLEPRDAKAKVGLLRFSLKHARSSFSFVQFVGVGSRDVLPLQRQALCLKEYLVKMTVVVFAADDEVGTSPFSKAS
jgi:hypothetical protein